jgi:hypothetical protein
MPQKSILMPQNSFLMPQNLIWIQNYNLERKVNPFGDFITLSVAGASEKPKKKKPKNKIQKQDPLEKNQKIKPTGARSTRKKIKK